VPETVGQTILFSARHSTKTLTLATLFFLLVLKTIRSLATWFTCTSIREGDGVIPSSVPLLPKIEPTLLSGFISFLRFLSRVPSPPPFSSHSHKLWTWLFVLCFVPYILQLHHVRGIFSAHIRPFSDTRSYLPIFHSITTGSALLYSFLGLKTDFPITRDPQHILKASRRNHRVVTVN
jgi:hypothetical protein